MYEIPTYVIVGDVKYNIRNRGDFRTILDCFSALNDVELSKQERLFASLIIFYEDLTCIEDVDKFDDLSQAIEAMYNFFNCGDTLKTSTQNYKLIDWEKDSQLISSAINKVAGTEIRFESYIHWWTFMGYYMAIGESPISTIISIRDKIMRGKKLEKYEQQFRRDNPHFFMWKNKTVEQEEADLLVQQLWNGGEK